MPPDDETAEGFNFELAPAQPVQARYVRYRLTAARSVTASEAQVYDWVKHGPFDMRLSLPPAGNPGEAGRRRLRFAKTASADAIERLLPTMRFGVRPSDPIKRPDCGETATI